MPKIIPPPRPWATRPASRKREGRRERAEERRHGVDEEPAHEDALPPVDVGQLAEGDEEDGGGEEVGGGHPAQGDGVEAHLAADRGQRDVRRRAHEGRQEGRERRHGQGDALVRPRRGAHGRARALAAAASTINGPVAGELDGKAPHVERSLEGAGQHRRLARAGHEDEDVAGRLDHRRRDRHPPQRRLRAGHGDDPLATLVEGRRAGEERGGVAVLAHAEDHDVERVGQELAVGSRGRGGDRPRPPACGTRARGPRAGRRRASRRRGGSCSPGGRTGRPARRRSTSRWRPRAPRRRGRTSRAPRRSRAGSIRREGHRAGAARGHRGPRPLDDPLRGPPGEGPLVGDDDEALAHLAPASGRQRRPSWRGSASASRGPALPRS